MAVAVDIREQISDAEWQARIDLAEGEARKLQFAGAGCVLDIFLYPPAKGSEPIATYIETRRRDSGGAVEQTACIKAIEAGQ